MNFDQAFTFGQEAYTQDNQNQNKHPKISKKSPFYQIVKPTISQNGQRTLKSINKENCNYSNQKHKRNPSDINLFRIETSPESNNYRCERKIQTRKQSFNTPKLPPINNEQYQHLMQQIKKLIQKQKQFIYNEDLENAKIVVEQLELMFGLLNQLKQ